MFERIQTAPSIGPALSLLFGFGALFCFVIGAVVIFVVAWSFLRRSKAGVKLDDLATSITPLAKVNVADGIDEREWEIIRGILSKQKAAEDEAAVKERLLSAAKPTK